jgi:hypothetical protein
MSPDRFQEFVPAHPRMGLAAKHLVGEDIIYSSIASPQGQSCASTQQRK